MHRNAAIVGRSMHAVPLCHSLHRIVDMLHYIRLGLQQRGPPMEEPTCDQMLASHVRPNLLPNRSELGHDTHDIVEDLADKTLNVLGPSFVLLREGQCHPAELLWLLLQYIELSGEHCALGHSEGQLPSHKPRKRELPE